MEEQTTTEKPKLPFISRGSIVQELKREDGVASRSNTKEDLSEEEVQKELERIEQEDFDANEAVREATGAWAASKNEPAPILYRIPPADQIQYIGEKNPTTGEPHGMGKMAFKDGGYMEGQWIKCNLVKGSIKTSEIDYDGELKNKLFHGWGKAVFSDGTLYEGGWLEGRYHGKGKFASKKGDVYEGQFKVSR